MYAFALALWETGRSCGKRPELRRLGGEQIVAVEGLRRGSDEREPKGRKGGSKWKTLLVGGQCSTWNDGALGRLRSCSGEPDSATQCSTWNKQRGGWKKAAAVRAGARRGSPQSAIGRLNRAKPMLLITTNYRVVRRNSQMPLLIPRWLRLRFGKKRPRKKISQLFSDSALKSCRLRRSDASKAKARPCQALEMIRFRFRNRVCGGTPPMD